MQATFSYYQKDKNTKLIVQVDIKMKNYKSYEDDEDAIIVHDDNKMNYNLILKFEPLSYFHLINSFQFSLPIYILLFSLVSLVLILGIVVFWLLNIQCSRFKRPPAIRFYHMIEVTFLPPALGTTFASIPVGIAALACKLLQDSNLFVETRANWAELGSSNFTDQQIIGQQRGRLGIAFTIIGIVFMLYGSSNIIYKPTQQEEEEIRSKKKAARRKEKLELSKDASDADDHKGSDEEKEEEVKIKQALNWKRRHFFINLLIVALFLMVKLEFSYTEIFGRNILTFLIIFTFVDILIEQLLTRIIMSEALLVAPVLGSFVLTEFIMTMGAEDFQSFIVSYFIEISLIVFSRTYLGPAIEKFEILL